MNNTIDKDTANIVFTKWEVFHKDTAFKQAVTNKQIEFKNAK